MFLAPVWQAAAWDGLFPLLWPLLAEASHPGGSMWWAEHPFHEQAAK